MCGGGGESAILTRTPEASRLQIEPAASLECILQQTPSHQRGLQRRVPNVRLTVHRGANHSFWHDDVPQGMQQLHHDVLLGLHLQTGQRRHCPRQAAPKSSPLPRFGCQLSDSGLGVLDLGLESPQTARVYLNLMTCQSRDFLFVRSCACTSELHRAEALPNKHSLAAVNSVRG